MTADAERLNQPLGNYPFLGSLLKAKGLTDKGIWSIGDLAGIFAVKSRAVYDWIANGKLAVRDLPGRGRFLSADIEEFLTNSRRVPKGRNGSQEER
jgi:hypothetical protein